MKYILADGYFSPIPSPPARGAWIEIPPSVALVMASKSPPARGAWIEMLHLSGVELAALESPPARGAWIEISQCPRLLSGKNVAPRTGGVD